MVVCEFHCLFRCSQTVSSVLLSLYKLILFRFRNSLFSLVSRIHSKRKPEMVVGSKSYSTMGASPLSTFTRQLEEQVINTPVGVLAVDQFLKQLTCLFGDWSITRRVSLCAVTVSHSFFQGQAGTWTQTLTS